MATELSKRDRPVAPLNFRSGFRALACRDPAAATRPRDRYRSGASYLSAYGLNPGLKPWAEAWAILCYRFAVNATDSCGSSTAFTSFTYEARPLPNDQSSRVFGERFTWTSSGRNPAFAESNSASRL
jgi:hypothetical protein